MPFPKFTGISRDGDSPRQAALLIFPERYLTDDEVRALHDYLNSAYCQSEFDFRERSKPANQN